MRSLSVILSFVFIALQYRLWFGENSLSQLAYVREQAEHQQSINARLKARNDALSAEVVALQRSDQDGRDAIEGLARRELGMVRSDETFFYMPD